MTWLARLKNQQGTEPDATKATKPSFVAFVAYTQTPFEISNADSVGSLVESLDGACDDIAKARHALFFDRGLTECDSRVLVDKLAARDLTLDDRRVCLECLHLSGTVTSRRCSNWQKLGISSPAVVADLADILQRCVGFNPVRHDGSI